MTQKQNSDFQPIQDQNPTDFPVNHTASTTPAEPVTAPVSQETPVVEKAPVPAEQPVAPKKQEVKSSLAGGTWAALIAGALLLIVLLVFIMQNQQQVTLTLFAWDFSMPAGVGFLLAAIVGALIMAMVGVVRMYQLRRQIKKAQRA